MHIFRKPDQENTKKLFSIILVLATSVCAVFQSVSAKTISEPYQLNASLQVFGDVVRSRLSDDGQYVVYASDQDVNGQFEIFSVRIIGGDVIKLNSQLMSPDSTVGLFKISPDSQWVVYRADSLQDGTQELFSVPIGGGTSVRLNVNLPAGGDIQLYEISPDSARVVFTADQIVNDRLELFSVSISGGSIQRLNSTLPAGGRIEQFAISPNSESVIYIADRNVAGDNGLYSTAISVGGASLLSGSRNVLDFKVRPDSAFVAFRARIGVGGVQLYRVATLGSFVLRLSSELPDGGNVGHFQISADNSRVVYLADQNTDGVTELFSVTFGASGLARLNGNLAISGEQFVGDVVEFKLSQDGQRVLYHADQIQNDVFELFEVAVGGGANTRMNSDLPVGGDVVEVSFKFTPDGSKVVYQAEQAVDNIIEIFSVPVSGGTPTKLNGNLPNSGVVVFDFKIAPDSSYVVYHAQQNTAGVNELYLVPVDGGTSKRINGDLPVGADVEFQYRISSDGQHVVYRADQDVFDEIEMFAVSVEDEDEETCFPIKTRNGGLAVFCL